MNGDFVLDWQEARYRTFTEVTAWINFVARKYPIKSIKVDYKKKKKVFIGRIKYYRPAFYDRYGL